MSPRTRYIVLALILALIVVTVLVVRRENACDHFESRVKAQIPSYPSLKEADGDLLARLAREQPAGCDVFVPVVN